MATVQQVLDKARSTIGEMESPRGSNQIRFATWAGIPGLAWCAAWVSWCFHEVGMGAEVPQFVWCPSGVNHFKGRGQWGSQPQIGAVVFFQWPGVGRAAHVGIVEAIRDDGAVVTIEGNTDERGGGTGGKVMRHVRRAHILGYGYPRYEAVTPDIPHTIEVVARPMLRRGSRGPNVLILQKRLGAWRINPGPEDGIFGGATDRAVRTFQRQKGLGVDGIVGPKTWAALG